MKQLLIILLATSALAQSPAPTPAPISVTATIDVNDLNIVRVNLPDLGTFINAGAAPDAMKRYPAIAVQIRQALEASLDSMDEITASKRLADISAAGIALNKAVTDKHAARIAKFAKDKEVLLLKVKDVNAPRAKQKMDEFIAAGITISKATQDAVIAALPPPMRPQPPAPTPTPDGL